MNRCPKQRQNLTRWNVLLINTSFQWGLLRNPINHDFFHIIVRTTEPISDFWVVPCFGKFLGARPDFKNVQNWPICCRCIETRLLQNTTFTPWCHTCRLVKKIQTTAIIAAQYGKRTNQYFNENFKRTKHTPRRRYAQIENLDLWTVVQKRQQILARWNVLLINTSF